MAASQINTPGNAPMQAYLGANDSEYCYYMASGVGSKIWAASPGGAYGAAYGAGDILTFLVDFTDQQLSVLKNGVSQGVMYSGSTFRLTSYVICVAEMGITASTPTYTLLAAPMYMPSGYTAW
jgi:hypothetical protein